MMDIALITAGQMYRYYLRQVLVGDGRRPARKPLRRAQQDARVPAGRWMGRGLPALGLALGQEVNEAQLRSLFGEGRHPDAGRLVAEQLAAGKTPAAARRAGALGRKVKVTGADLVFRPQVTLQLLWALGDEETRKAIEAAHERAIAVVLAWIEDDVAVIRHGAQGIHRTRPAHGLVAARFRHYEARSGMPLLHDHLLLSLRALRPDGVWGAVHSTALLESAVAASALYNEVVMMEACEALGLASEPRTVTAGRRPVMEVAGVPHELIRWTARRSEQIAACLTDLEHEYVTATDDDGTLKFAPVVSERARAKMNRIAARKTRPAKLRARSLARLREDWQRSARSFLAAGAHLIDSLLERARAAARAIRARIAAVVDVDLAAVAVTATVFVMNKDGYFHRRHLLAEARRHLALVQRGRRREPGLDDRLVDAALAEHCTDITEARTERGEEPGYRLYTARWSPAAPPPSRIPAAASGRDRKPVPDPAAPFLPMEPGEWDIPRVPLRHDRAVIATRVLTARLRTARRTGRPLYGTAAHQPSPEQLPLFTREQPAAATAGPTVDLEALRTDLEALGLTAEQLDYVGRAGQRLAALRKDANRRADRAAAGSASSAQDAPDAHHQDEQHAYRQHPYEPGRGHGAPR
ncbi:relaxase domain-containing protein [Streptomyces sp. NBC_01242]|uniref:MobF family relaxase n=1 Tax=Streptomyces sp. NBC_01242 TaxID=2903795 RepID=UPI002254F77A|nr:MobF family relaxase [Streptomyces sp. NBC_01242]MCX4799889.1 relaxase domain-containing protein [Streptomyces sp. NBC_01242]